VLDFAGGLVVETASGVSAFVLAFWIGPGQTMHGGGHHHHKPHNVPFTLLGAGLLWIGWFFFNSGSALAAGYTAGRSFANTHLCASAAMVTWSLAEVVWGGEGWFAGRPSAIGAATGAVVGLVAITPACGYVSQMSSLLIGFIAAPTSYWAIRLLKHSGVDDRLECLPAHGVAGALGTLLTGLFASANEGARNSSGEPVNGAFFGNGALLGKQLAALLITIVICVVNTSVCFWIVWGVSKLTGGRLPLRVQQELQDRVDAAEHGEHAYHYTGLSRGASAYGVLGDAPPSPLSHGAHVHHRSLSAVKVGAGGSAAGQALLPPPSAAPAPALPSPAAAVAAAMDSLAASILVDAGLASPATQPLPVDGARHYRRPTGEAADDMAVQLMQVPPALAGSPARSTLQ
jgi:Amt family ammonium transporter